MYSKLIQIKGFEYSEISGHWHLEAIVFWPNLYFLLIGKTSNINFDQKNNNNINKKINLRSSLNQNKVISLNLRVTGMILKKLQGTEVVHSFISLNLTKKITRGCGTIQHRCDRRRNLERMRNRVIVYTYFVRWHFYYILDSMYIHKIIADAHFNH